MTVSETFKRQEPYSRDSKKSKEITAKVMEFIGLDQQPLSVVEDDGFRRLITTLDPRYILPDVCLPQLYQTVYTHIDSILKDNVTSVSFTSDIWSSSACPMSMLSLTAPFIDQDFKPHNTTAETDHGVKTSKATLLEAIQRRFGDICSQRLYAIATLLDSRYKDRYFPDALKPQLRVLLLGILDTRSGSSPEQHEKRSEASGSEPPEKCPRAGSLQAMYEELLDGDVEHGAGSNDSSQ
ncbi:hypothetical protein F7725_005214 [Dissostichus mawsoni]|uniref:Uncharacterized protein n=1 Tax=Dissostichus mawsoni TaxID=36200 RepID=A0A7J5YT39_DISMA|nr:hypothetical protein F7725_005214 [Dissostichus mawsoni]